MRKFFLLIFALTVFNFSFSQRSNLKVDDTYVKNIKKIANNNKVKKAFKYILDVEDKTNKNLIELTEIEAPPFKEEKRAMEFSERLKLAGIEKVWIDSIGNVIGFLEGSIGNKNIAIPLVRV